MCYLAEHGSPDIGLRFTRDGYLTADLHMDLPPMRCVLIDPYTGCVGVYVCCVCWWVWVGTCECVCVVCVHVVCEGTRSYSLIPNTLGRIWE